MTIQIKKPKPIPRVRPELPTHPGLYIDAEGALWKLSHGKIWTCLADDSGVPVFADHTRGVEQYLPFRPCEYLEYR